MVAGHLLVWYNSDMNESREWKVEPKNSSEAPFNYELGSHFSAQVTYYRFTADYGGNSREVEGYFSRVPEDVIEILEVGEPEEFTFEVVGEMGKLKEIKSVGTEPVLRLYVDPDNGDITLY